MFGQSLLSGAFGTALVPDENFNTALYTGNGSGLSIGGKINGAANFNGSSSVINISSSTINVGTPYTISMWLNFSDVTAYKGVFANITSSRLTNEIAVVLNNGKITIYSVASNGNTNLDAINATPQSAIANNTWYNVVIVADRSLANKAKVYFNSVETSYTYSAGVAGTAAYSNTKIGLADGQYFDGQMDQIRLFNSVLTTSQISDLYGETSETASTLDFPAGAGCVTGYTLDTNANTIAPIPNSTTGVTTCDFPTGAGCQALYQLEDNVTDTCGNYNGTANNITYASGVFDNAASFNGTSSYIDIGGTIANSQSNLTVSMWLYWDGNTSNANDYFILLGNSSAGTAGSLFACNIITASGILRFYNGSTTYDSTSAISANTWTQIAITYASSGDLKFYINGNLDASHSAGALSLGASSNRGLIGGYVFGANPVSLYYGGSIDQVRIFNTVLTQSQVNELSRGAEYNGTSSNVIYPGFLNFQPDFVWTKSRNSVNSHQLFDSVRGATFAIESDTAFAQSEETTALTSFDSNGFSLGSSSNVNSSSTDYVAWSWKGGADIYGGVFNGSSSAIVVPNNILSSNFSISAWFYLNNTSGNQYIFEFDYENRVLFRVTSTDSNKAYIGNSGYFDYGVTFSAGQWYHLVITFSNGNPFKIYVDNTLSYTGGNTSVSAFSNDNILGAANSSGSGAVNGMIDQVRIFNTTLSASEVTSLYNETASENSTLNFPTGAGCIAAYTLNETANDLSGNYNGTPYNITYVKPGYTGKNNDGTIESQVSVNVDAGFSIVKYTGNGSASQTYGHGLSNKPSLIITKKTSGSQNWTVWHEDLTSDNYFLYLNTDAAEADGVATVFNSGISTSLVGIGNSGLVNDSGQDYISYCFASISAYSKIGSYSGTGATNNITGLGFEPRWVLIKCTDSGGTNWQIWDSARTTGYNLFPNLDIAEVDNSSTFTGFTADGFTVAGTSGSANASGSTYLYMAFA